MSGWMRRAACAGHPELMAGTEVAAALRRCGSCPVLGDCRAWALWEADVAGVCGGMTEDDRAGWRARHGVTVAPVPLLAVLPFDVLVRDLLDEGRRDEARSMLIERGASAQTVAAAVGGSPRTEVRRRRRDRDATLTPTLNPV